jgi:hypothetical protein
MQARVVCRIDRAFEHLAQLQPTWILTMLVRMAAEGAHAGGSKSGIASRGPIQIQTKPPASRQGYALWRTFFARTASCDSDSLSTTLPSTSIFQP